jgi:hypothetical protein
MLSGGDGAALFLGGFGLCAVIFITCIFFDIFVYNKARTNCYIFGIDLFDFCWCGSRSRAENNVELQNNLPPARRGGH